MSVPVASAETLRSYQFTRLQVLLKAVLPTNAFYSQKFAAAEVAEITSRSAFEEGVPFTTKLELVEDQLRNPPYGSNLTFHSHRYTRFHQTSGTTGKPLRWLDTTESWSALIDNWVEVFTTAGVTHQDHIFYAFSFGPFLGFWLAFEAGARMGALCLPAGGLNSEARLQVLLENKATVLCCTPTYAIHLAEVAKKARIDLSKSSIRLIVVAGEAGGSLPATRAYIEGLWPGARVYDHHGMTETGPITYECPAHPCRLHVIDRSYIAEVIDPANGSIVEPGREGELVITNLHRTGSPLIRYRTGDLVRLADHHRTGSACACGRSETALEGGILGRSDDMVVVRGVNVYPSAIEQIVRTFPEIMEYQVKLSKKSPLVQLHVLIEPAREVKDLAGLVMRVERALQTALTLRIPVALTSPESLPRPELKAKRWIVER